MRAKKTKKFFNLTESLVKFIIMSSTSYILFLKEVISKNFLFHLGILLTLISFFFPFAYFQFLDIELQVIRTIIRFTEDSFYQIFIILLTLYPYLRMFFVWIYLFFTKKIREKKDSVLKKKSKKLHISLLFLDSYLPFLIIFYFYITYYFNPSQLWGFRVLGILIVSLSFYMSHLFFNEKKSIHSSRANLELLYHSFQLFFYSFFIYLVVFLKATPLVGAYSLVLGTFLIALHSVINEFKAFSSFRKEDKKEKKLT